MTDAVDTIIARVHSMSRGRTRYQGQPAHWDEVLVAKIERLRELLVATNDLHAAAQMDIEMANDALIEKCREIARLNTELARRDDQMHRIQQQINRLPQQLTHPGVVWAGPSP